MSSVRLHAELLAEGLHPDEVARLARREGMTRIRRGAYVAAADVTEDRRLAHLQLLEGTVRQCSPELVISHHSAAALHGLPLFSVQLSRVALTRDRRGGGQLRRYSVVHGLPLSAEDVVLIDGRPVTSLARTVLDLCCSEPMTRAVAVGDAALRRELPPEELALQLERGARRHGIGRARRAVAFLDRRSESPGESYSRVVIAQLGLPKPDLQVDIFGPDGEHLGRVDFDWPDRRTVGEFDGRIKYGRALRPGQPIEEVLVDEKVREDRIRDTDRRMLRWIWPELWTPNKFGTRLDRALRPR
jgi:hypothetical protein